MNISCKVIQDLLPLYHDGVTSLETNALVEEHLQTCEACQEEFHKLQEAVALALPSPEREEQKTESLKKVKRSLRYKRLAVIAITLAVMIAISIPVGMWMSIPCMTLPLEEVTIDITEENGILSIYSEATYGVTIYRVFYPDGTDVQPWERKNGAALILSADYTPLEGLETYFDDAKGEPISRLDQWATTEEGWWELHRDEVEYLESMDKMQEEYPDQPLPDYDPNAPRSPEEDVDFLYHGIKEVYYYDGLDAGIWEKENDELLADLEQHGTLLWTAEDGVVYNP